MKDKKEQFHIFSIRLNQEELDYVDSLRDIDDSRNRAVRFIIRSAMNNDNSNSQIVNEDSLFD